MQACLQYSLMLYVATHVPIGGESKTCIQMLQLYIYSYVQVFPQTFPRKSPVLLPLSSLLMTFSMVAIILAKCYKV